MGPAQTTGATTVPVQSTPSQGNPLLEAASAEVMAQQQAVQQAAQAIHKTPMFSTSSNATPVMPVPGMMGHLFGGASVKNLAGENPTTRAGARNKAIGQIAAQGAGIIGKYFQKKEAEKTQALAQDIHRTLELTEGMDQAKAALQDPNISPQDKQAAQAQIQKNQALLTSLLNGKNGKEIAKAYDVSFGKESQSTSMEDKNASMHYKAMQDAMKQRGIDREKMFEQQIPQKMSINPAYQRAYQQYQDTVKNANEAQKNLTALYGHQLQYQGKVDSQMIKDQDAAVIQEQKDASAGARAAAHDQAVVTSAELHKEATVNAAAIRAKVAKEVATMAHSDKDRIALGLGKSKELTAEIVALRNNSTKLQSDLDKAKKSKDSKQQARVEAQIAENQKRIDEANQERSMWSLYAEGDPQSKAALELLGDDEDE